MRAPLPRRLTADDLGIALSVARDLRILVDNSRAHPQFVEETERQLLADRYRLVTDEARAHMATALTIPDSRELRHCIAHVQHHITETEDDLAGVDVEDVIFGMQSSLPAPVPAAMFRTNAFGPQRWPSMLAGQEVRIQFLNRGPARKVAAVLFCETGQPGRTYPLSGHAAIPVNGRAALTLVPQMPSRLRRVLLHGSTRSPSSPWPR